jgi:NDP-sugar pyrophosphorylase family protein
MSNRGLVQMRAIILAGGKGARLRPYTTLIPKPLVPIGDQYSIVEIVIKQLVKCGFTHITLAVNHLSKLIMAYFADGKELGVKIDYSVEEKELSTIGPLTLIEDLPDNFLVMNGDILCDLNYGQFLKTHIATKNHISVSSFNRNVEVDFGVLQYDTHHRLTGFQEKPELSYDVSMGIYCLHKSIIHSLPKDQAYGFDTLMKDSIDLGKHVQVYPFKGFWLDIGRPKDYEYANENYHEILYSLGFS